MKKTVLFCVVFALVLSGLVSCQNKSEILRQVKSCDYIVDDGTETLVSYSDITITRNGNNEIEQLVETYSPDGILWFTLKNNEFIYTNDYTDDIKEKHEKTIESTAFSLVGKNSDDLIYEPKYDESGEIVEEMFSSKSGNYTAYKIVYEIIK